MEVDDIQTQRSSRKLPRLSSGRNSQNDEENGQLVGRANTTTNNNGVIGTGGGGINNRLRGWNPSSRIIRVSRASGGKDRHSKVLTSKGLRDRRIRLSVGTAIQFYDLQDRLGLDQPSKAVEWLLKEAEEAIADLPSVNTLPEALSDEKMASNGGNEQGLVFGSAEGGLDGVQNQNQTLSLSKSACSSTSETSKNSSALSLSRSDIRGSNRVKARERARERTAKEKEKERENDVVAMQQNNSFTQLLTAGFSNENEANRTASGSGHPNPARQWTAGSSSSSVEYFTPVQLIPPSSSSFRTTHQGYNGQIHIGSSPLPYIIPPFAISGAGDSHHHQEPLHQHFSFVTDALIQTAAPVGAAAAGDYNTLNFSISSPGGGIAGYSRGTLQSNSPSLFLNNVQRFSSSSSSSSSPMDTQNVPFFMATPPPLENHHHHIHQFPAGFDGRLHLYYGDGSRCSNHKDKEKS